MDTQIRPRNPVGMPSPGRRTGTLRLAPKGTATSLRKAILECAVQATVAEPTDTDARLHSFIAKLSGTMEGLGERELDAALWNLMTTHRQPTADEQLGIDWWNGLTEERRAHWLRVANSAAPFAAWQAFCAAESDLAVDGVNETVLPGWASFHQAWKGGHLSVPYCSCLSEDLYIAYRCWVDKSGETSLTLSKFAALMATRERKARLNVAAGASDKTIRAVFIVENPTWTGNQAEQIARFRAAVDAPTRRD